MYQTKIFVPNWILRILYNTSACYDLYLVNNNSKMLITKYNKSQEYIVWGCFAHLIKKGV